MPQEIWNGDCRELIADIEDDIDCIITDPPYGMGFVSNMARTPKGKEYNKRAIEADGDLDGAITLFQEVMDLLIPKMADHSDLYVFTQWRILDKWMDAVKMLPGITYNMLIVWEKGGPGMGDLRYSWGCGHELILYCKKGQRKPAFRRSSVIHVEKLYQGDMIHPTEKPVPLIEHFVKMSTDPGDLIVDPFGGSCSTAVAADRLGRDYIVIEKDPTFYDRARKRLETPAMDLF